MAKRQRLEPAPTSPWIPPTWLFAAVLLAVGLWSYSNSFSGVFMGDDADAIAQNPAIKSLRPTTGPRDTTLAGRPVSSFSFALNYALAPAHARDVMDLTRPFMRGGNPDDPYYENLWGYHAVNLLIHLLAGLALFGVLRRTLLSPALSPRFGRAAPALAFAIAVIWIAHPLNTASVTYIVQRVESLMGLFYLLTLYCAIRAAESDFQNRRWVIASAVFCALGMGTKEAMVSAPIFVALWIWICRPDLQLLGKPRLLLGLLAATWVILIVLGLSPNRSLSVGFGLGGWTWWLYLRTQAAVIVHYLQLAFWPSNLVFAYQWLPAASWTDVLPQFLLLGALFGATVFGAIRRSAWALLGAWFFLILAPSSSILPIASEVAADHRMYLPLAAVIGLIVLGVWAFLGRKDVKELKEVKVTPLTSLTLFTSLTIALVLSLATRARNEHYENFETMAQTMVAAQPSHAAARLIVASNLIRRQKFAEAEAELRTAIELPLPPGTTPQPRSLMHLYLGTALGARQALPEAAIEFEKSAAMYPQSRDVHGLLAETLLKLGRVREAVSAYERGITHHPDATSMINRLAWIRATTADDSVRDGERALKDAETAVAQSQGRDALALSSLAAAYAETGQFDRAIASVERALAVTPPPAEAVINTLRTHRALFAAGQKIRIHKW